MPTKTAGELRNLVSRILRAVGADGDNAERVAQALVSADLAGVDTHGVFQLPRYVTSIEDGELVPSAHPEVIKESTTTAMISGNWTFGQVAAGYAMQKAICKAKESNVAIVGMVQAYHIGRLGEYSEMAAEQEMVSMVFGSGYAEGLPSAVPFGGREKVLQSNPIAMGFPAGRRPSMIIDIATSIVANNKINLARAKNQPLPLGWIIDKDGNPTTDPLALDEGGGVLPFGGHKGYALMLAAEFLGRILTGSKFFAEDDLGGPVMREQGVTMVVFRADLFQSLDAFIQLADVKISQMKKVVPAPGFKEVLVPGDVENQARMDRRTNGIPLSDAVWRSLTELSGSLGISVG